MLHLHDLRRGASKFLRKKNKFDLDLQRRDECIYGETNKVDCNKRVEEKETTNIEIKIIEKSHIYGSTKE